MFLVRLASARIITMRFAIFLKKSAVQPFWIAKCVASWLFRSFDNASCLGAYHHSSTVIVLRFTYGGCDLIVNSPVVPFCLTKCVASWLLRYFASAPCLRAPQSDRWDFSKSQAYRHFIQHNSSWADFWEFLPVRLASARITTIERETGTTQDESRMEACKVESLKFWKVGLPLNVPLDVCSHNRTRNWYFVMNMCDTHKRARTYYTRRDPNRDGQGRISDFQKLARCQMYWRLILTAGLTKW